MESSKSSGNIFHIVTEEEVTMTNVGSIMPKFKFIELEN